MSIQRLPYGNRIPGVMFTEETITPSVGGSRDTITCILGTATTGPSDPTIVSSLEDFKLLFGSPLPDNYGVKAANVILPNTIMYVRVLSSGARTTFKDGSTTVFVAKNGGTHLQSSQVSVIAEGEVIKVELSQDDAVLETIICSSNPLDSEYIHSVFDNYSSYLNLAVSSDYEFTDKAFVGTGGTTGALQATGTSENMEIQSKYADSRINGTNVHLLQNVQGKPYVQVIKDNVVIEEIPVSGNIETIEDFRLRVNSSSAYINITKLDSIDPVTVTLSGGNAGTTSLDDADYFDAIDKVADPSIYKIDTLIIPGVTSNAVQAKAMRVCEERGDTIFIADAPLGLRGSLVRDFVKGQGRFSVNTPLTSDQVTVLSPWIKYNDGAVSFYPPSIILADTLATNDKKFNVWSSSAGIKRGLVTKIAGLEYNPTKSELNILYNDALVNPIVYLTGKGYVIWGNKTTKIPTYANAPEPICSLNVRRLVNYLRKAIYDAMLPFVFETNDSFTWASVRNVVCPLLDAIKDNRGLDDYRFICDETVNTAEAIDQLQLNCTLSIRPTRCAEYINVDLKIYPYTVEFEGGE